MIWLQLQKRRKWLHAHCHNFFSKSVALVFDRFSCSKLENTKQSLKKLSDKNMEAQALKGKAVGSNIYTSLGLDDYDIVSGTPKIVSVLSSVLEKNIQRNEKLLKATGKKDAITIFHGSRSPALSIQHYLDRIFKYSNCSHSCFIVAYIYIERFLQQMDASLTSLNVHRLLITSIMLAAKFLDDVSYNNAYYAKVGGVSLTEINKLEEKFLASVDFRLHITVETFDKYCLQLEDEAAGRRQIGMPIRICGLSKSWSNNDASNSVIKLAGHICKAV